MNNKEKHFIISVSLLLFLVALMLWYANTHSTFRVGESDFSVSRNLDISMIHLSSKANDETVTMSLARDGQWYLNDNYPANESAVQQLLDVLVRLTIQQPVSLDKREDVNRMYVEQGVEVKVFAIDYHVKLGNKEFIPYERTAQSFWVAGNVPDGNSTYMKKPDTNVSFQIHVPGLNSGLFMFFDTNFKVWIDPVIIDVERNNIAQISVKVTGEPDESYHLKQTPDGTFSFWDYDTHTEFTNLVIDTARVLRFLSSFKGLHYESLLDDEEEELRRKTIFDNSFMEITITNKQGIETEFVSYRRLPQHDELLQDTTMVYDPNRFYIQLHEDEYAIGQYYVFNRIMRPLSFFNLATVK